jgi:hypothetical protein
MCDAGTLLKRNGCVCLCDTSMTQSQTVMVLWNFIYEKFRNL